MVETVESLRHEAVAMAVGHLQTVPAFRFRRIPRTELLWGWKDPETDARILARVQAGFEGNPPEYDCGASIQVERSLPDWPEAIAQQARNQGQVLTPVTGNRLNENHILEIDFTRDDVAWAESKDYVLVSPNNGYEVIDTHEATVDDHMATPFSNEALDMAGDSLFAEFEVIGQALNAERTHRRLQQAQAIIRCIQDHEPINVDLLLTQGEYVPLQ